MYEDNEGFLYPHTDVSLCIDCGLCEKVCPVIQQEQRRIPLKCFAAINPDVAVRKKSSSGGVFTMLAEAVIDEGGVVFGAAWNERWEVEHTYTQSKDGLASFRGSKYIQSIVGDSYKQAESFLKNGRKVLFSGTPCQIAGLRMFLQKDYENLLVVDFICHGVPSPGVFRWYLQEEINNYVQSISEKSGSPPHNHFIPKRKVLLPAGINIESINFRDKREGWKQFSFNLQLSMATDKSNKKTVSISSTLHEHSFLKGFLNNYYLRPSCHQCPAKQFKSGSDLTLADYWGYQNDALQDDDTGISAILISSEKGLHAFKATGCTCVEVPYSDILRFNGAAEHSVSGPYRAYFYKFKQKGMPFEQVIVKLSSTKLINKVFRRIWLQTHKNS